MSMPVSLENIVSDFKKAPKQLRLQLLLEYSKKLPPLPPHLEGSDLLEQVHECQTPFFLTTEFSGDNVSLYFDAPAEAPTTRGFAGILYEGLNNLSTEEILKVPSTFYYDLQLGEIISPLRLRGMEGILRRLKRQVSEHLEKIS